MDHVPKNRKRARWILFTVIGVPCLLFVLAPFPGMAMIYAITDPLRGHPSWEHGEHPAEFEGLWVNEEPVDFGFDHNVISFSPGGQMPNYGMTRRKWHADRETLYIDGVSGCGNCYRGVRTQTLEVEFDGADRMRLTRREPSRDDRGIGGWYVRTPITDDLKQRMTLQAEVDDYALSSQARSILRVIEDSEGHRK